MITTSRILLLVLATMGLLAACADHAAQQSRLVRVELTGEANNTGRIGYVTLIPHDQTTEFSFFVNGTSGRLRPIRVYSFVYPGPCADRGAQPLYAMNDQVITFKNAAGWTFNRTAKVALDTLSGAHHSVVVTSGPEEGNAPQFCGDIP